MEEIWRNENRDGAPLSEWFRGYPKNEMVWSDWKAQNLRSDWEDDVDFALGLGMKIVLGGRGVKKPLKGIKWGSRDHIFPGREEILDHLRKKRGNIAAEMGRSNLIGLDIDKKYDPDNWLNPYLEKTLVNLTPHGYHLIFWNDIFRIRLGHQKSGKPWPPIKSEWLKHFLNHEKPGFLDAVLQNTDITRIRNELLWIPPSETRDGRYKWSGDNVNIDRKPPMLFSELLISLSKGRR